MGFTPSGGNMKIKISAEDNASDDIQNVQDEISDLGTSAGGISGLMGKLEDAIDDVTSEMKSLVGGSTTASGALQTLQGRTDEAEDEMEQLGDDTSRTSSKLTTFAGSAGSAAGAMSTFSAVTAMSAVPSLTALSSVAVPLTATLGALGTASLGVASGFTAVIGTGMYAYGKKLAGQNKKRLKQTKKKISKLQALKKKNDGLTKAQQKQLTKLKQQRKEAKKTTTVMGALAQEFKPVKKQISETALELGTQFIPLVRDAIDALPQFIRNVQKAIGPLQPFADALRRLGKVASRVIPNIVKQVMNMGRGVLPEFTKLITKIMQGVVPTLKAMNRTAKEVAPLFAGIGEAIVTLAPKINELGLTILKTVIPRIRDTISLILEWNKKTDGMMLKLVLFGSALTTAIGILGSFGSAIMGVVGTLTTIVGVLGGPVTLAIAGVGVAIYGLYKAWQNNTMNIREKTAQLKEGISVAFNFVRDDIKKVGDAIGALKNSVISSFSKLSDEFNTLWVTVRNAFTLSEQKTKQLEGTITRFSDMVVGALETVGKIVDWVVTNHYQPMMQRINKLTKTHLGDTVNEFIETFDVIVTQIETFITICKKLWKRYGDEIMAFVRPFLKGLRVIFAQVFDTIMTTIRVALNLIQGDWKEAWSTIKAFLGRTFGRMDEMLTVFKDMLTASWDMLCAVLDDAWTAVWNGIKSTINDTIDGIVSYLKTGAKKDISNAIGVVIDALKAPFEWLYNKLIGNSLIKDMIGDIASYLKNAGKSKIKSGISALIGVITSAFENLYESLIGNSLVKDIFEDIASYLKGTGKSIIENAVDNLVQGMKDAFSVSIDGPSISWPDVPDWLSWDGSSFNLASAVPSPGEDDSNDNSNDSSDNSGGDTGDNPAFNGGGDNGGNPSSGGSSDPVGGYQPPGTTDPGSGNDDDDDGGSSNNPGAGDPGSGSSGPGMGSPGTGPIANPTYDDDYYYPYDDEDDEDDSGGSFTPGLGGPTAFASGGIVTKPTMGLIGEAGHDEAVMPLDKLSSVMKAEYRAGVQAAERGAQNVSVDITFNGDGELAEAFREEAEVVVHQNEQDKQDRLQRF